MAVTQAGRLRVLQLLPDLGQGGLERSAVEMARFLAGEGVDSWVASLGGPLAAGLTEAGVHHVEIAVGSKSPLAILGNAVRVGRLIDREEIDLVHVRSRAPAWVGWLAASRFSRRRPAFVATAHGLYSSGSVWKRRYNAVLLKGPLVIANSDGVRRHLIDIYGIAPERVVTAWRGIDESEFDPARFDAGTAISVCHEFGIPADAAILLMVGRLTRWKGQHVLIEALSHIGDRDWHLLVVGEAEGDGHYATELAAHAEATGFGNRFHFTGGRSDVARLNFAADLAFSCSTRPEAFGRVAIEAGAMGTPIIATAHGGSLETIVDGTTGWLVPPSDAAALGAAIRRALDDPAALRAAGDAAREHVHARFTARRTCEAEFAVYRRLLTRNSGT